MVKTDTIAIIFIVACVITVGTLLYVSFSYEPIMEYPESEIVTFKDIGYMKGDLRDFRVVVQYNFDKIHEGDEFRVDVFDRNTEKVVEDANVSFMIPEINHLIPKEGYVYFYAPKIRDKYLLHQNDTSRTFPITVKKEGYKTYHKTIEVHLAP